MRVSLTWLKEYVTPRLTPRQIAERLTLAGLEVTDCRVMNDEVLFECEVTPNRPDWLSHVGVARELAAITGSPLHLPAVALPKAVAGPRPTVTIQDRKACRRYVGTLIEGVTVGPSPAWLTARLAAIGVRSINNVVDITNFCLFEIGQPLHAFDADRLAKGRIVVRRARSGERLITIDGVERTLDPSILVVADAERPVAVAGIMGGQATEVTVATRRVLLESAWFDPLVIRRASRALRLASESSYRFERGVDFEQVAAAARRAAALIMEQVGGQMVGGPVDRRTVRAKPRPIPWDPSSARALGTTVPPARQRQLLERLGCRVVGTGARWRITPPSFRGDLRQPVDLLEEVARLWGYERLPVTLPRPIPSARRSVQETASVHEPTVDLWRRERRIREWLVASGLDEVMTYSLIGPMDLDRLTCGNPSLVPQLAGGSQVALRNPISQDYSILRQTLIIGALKTVAWNLNRRVPGVALFELGRTYHASTEGRPPDERRQLSLVLAGLRPGSWDAKPVPWNLFHAKGILDTVAQRLGARPLSWEPVTTVPVVPWLSRDGQLRAYALSLAGAPAPEVPPAILGLVLPTEAFDIPSDVEVIYAELAWPAWWGQPPAPVGVQPLPTMAPVTRDFAIVVEEPVTHAQIVDVVQTAGGPLVRQVTLFDCYRGSPVPPGKKSLAYTVAYSAGDRALTDAEVAAAHSAILDALRARVQATLRL